MDKNSPEYRKFISTEFFRIFGLIKLEPLFKIGDLFVEIGDVKFGKNEYGLYTPEIMDFSARFKLNLEFDKEDGHEERGTLS